MPCIVESPVARIVGSTRLAAPAARPRPPSRGRGRRARSARRASARASSRGSCSTADVRAAKTTVRQVRRGARRGDAELRPDAADAPAIDDPHARPAAPGDGARNGEVEAVGAGARPQLAHAAQGRAVGQLRGRGEAADEPAAAPGRRRVEVRLFARATQARRASSASPPMHSKNVMVCPRAPTKCRSTNPTRDALATNTAVTGAGAHGFAAGAWALATPCDERRQHDRENRGRGGRAPPTGDHAAPMTPACAPRPRRRCTGS